MCGLFYVILFLFLQNRLFLKEPEGWDEDFDHRPEREDEGQTIR